MIKRAHVFAAILWLLSSFSVQAQPGFSLPTLLGTTTGQNLDMPITVVNFDTVFAIQYVIQWDPQVLKFTGLSKPNNPLNIVDSLCFNLLEAPQGIIRFRWFVATPKTLADGTDIFHLEFKVISANGTASQVNFTEIPPTTYYEVVRGPGNQFFYLNNSPITNGLVVVGTIDAPEQPVAPVALSVAPNPFSGDLNLSFDMPESGDARLFITDLTGKICYDEKKYLNQGTSGTVIANGVFPAKGMYFVHLATSDQHFVQSIVFQ
jgi:hypothetical protein